MASGSFSLDDLSFKIWHFTYSDEEQMSSLFLVNNGQDILVCTKKIILGAFKVLVRHMSLGTL